MGCWKTPFILWSFLCILCRQTNDKKSNSLQLHYLCNMSYVFCIHSRNLCLVKTTLTLLMPRDRAQLLKASSFNMESIRWLVMQIQNVYWPKVHSCYKWFFSVGLHPVNQTNCLEKEQRKKVQHRSKLCKFSTNCKIPLKFKSTK